MNSSGQIDKVVEGGCATTQAFVNQPLSQAFCGLSMCIRKRVFTYITFNDQLLVLDHVNQPDLSMQIPGGTVEAGESPVVAAIREAEEETGLTSLKLKTFLGDFEKDLSSLGRAETIHAYFYHLEVMEPPAQRWLTTTSELLI